MDEYNIQWSTSLLATLLKMPITTPFREPVDPVEDGCPNYRKIIKRPMDLGTVQAKLETGRYATLKALHNDLALVCNNSIKYNGEDSIYGIMATDTLEYINRRFEAKPKSREEEWQQNLQKAVEDLVKHSKHRPDTTLI